MRKLLVTVAIATAALAAVPAAAQFHPGRHQGWDQRGPDRHRGWQQHGPSRHAIAQLLQQLDRAEQRIHRSARRGIISNREAFGLLRQASQVRNRLHWAGRNGLSGREFASLRFQVDRLEQRLRMERRDRDGRRG